MSEQKIKNKPQIPSFLSHLPVHRGYPVPYFVPQDDDGNFLFKYASWEKMENCIKYHKCCVCFKPLLQKNYWFISGPRGVVNMVDSHSPMHRNCAEHSMRICPHLYFEKTKRTTDKEDAENHQIHEKPPNLFLVGAKRFQKIPGEALISFKTVFFAERYAYEKGVLVKQENLIEK